MIAMRRRIFRKNVPTSNAQQTKTLKLAKMAFIGQETVRKQQRHNFL